MPIVLEPETQDKLKAEQTFEYTWRIRNFATIQQDKKELNQQTVELKLRHTCKSSTRWLVSLKAVPCSNEDRLYLNISLRDTKGILSNMLVANLTIVISKTGEAPWENWGKIQTPSTVKPDEGIDCDFNRRVNIDPTHWKSHCDFDGSLYLKLQLTVSCSELQFNKENSSFLSASFAKLQESFGGLLNDANFSNCKIVCSDGTELHANSKILAARNSVFESMFRANMSEKSSGVFQIDDISGPAMKILLHFWYTGHLLPTYKEPGVLPEILYAASKYQILEILELLDKMLGSADVPNCDIQTLSLVGKLELKNADARLLARIKNTVENVNSTEEFVKIFGGNVKKSSKS